MGSSKRPIRGTAAMAAMFVFTLVGYLFLTAVPAMAAEYDCAVTDAPDGGDHIVITLATDSRLALAVSNDDTEQPGGADGEYRVLDLDAPEDGWESLQDCTGLGGPYIKFGGQDWLDIRGTNNGTEHLTIVQPTGEGSTENIDTEVITLDLGAGNDSLTLEFGGFEGNPNEDFMDDPENDDDPSFLTADGPALLQQGTEQVIDFCDDGDGDCDTSGDGDMRIDDPMTVTVNTGEETDRIQASDSDIDYRSGPDDTTTDDDIPDADGLFDDPLEPDEDAVDGPNGVCDGKPFQLAMVMNGGPDDDNFESGLANDTINGGAGDDEVDYDGDSANNSTIQFCDGPGSVTVDLAGPPAAPAAGGSTGAFGVDVLNDIQDLEGTPHDDTLFGNDLSNDIRGDFGDDTIDGRAGDDGFEEVSEDDIGIDEGLEGDGEDSTEENCNSFSEGDDDEECHGDDTINGGTGNDEVDGDGGDDDLTGGLGNDEVEGDFGSDVVHEGPAASGADDLDGGENSNEGDLDVLDYSERTTVTAVIAGGGGASGQDVNADGDAADAGDENDTITFDFEGYRTGSANDTLIGDSSDESFEGGLGDDFIDGSIISGFDSGDDWSVYENCPAGITANMAPGTTPGTVVGCSTDTIVQIEGIVGTDFADTFNDDVDTDNGYVGGDGDDVFNQPQDPIAPNSDADHIEGGDGTDLIDMSTRTGDIDGDADSEEECGGFPVECDAGAGDSDDTSDGDEDGGEGDSWGESIENITTGSGEDQIVGNDHANVIDTGSGDDLAIGSAGNDTFPGGLGDDDVHAGEGNDVMETVEPATAAPGDSQGDGSDLFDGGNGFDFYDASGRTSSQNLTSDAICFQDDGVFGEGDGLCWVEAIVGGAGNDFIAGDNANSVLTGGAGDDNIQGLKGRDRLRGQAGDDRLSGGKGPDLLTGGAGTDTASGGPGADTCSGVETWNSCQLV